MPTYRIALREPVLHSPPVSGRLTSGWFRLYFSDTSANRAQPVSYPVIGALAPDGRTLPRADLKKLLRTSRLAVIGFRLRYRTGTGPAETPPICDIY